jgi:hypothetical protein
MYGETETDLEDPTALTNWSEPESLGTPQAQPGKVVSRCPYNVSESALLSSGIEPASRCAACRCAAFCWPVLKLS